MKVLTRPVCNVCQRPNLPGGHFDRDRLIEVGVCSNCDFWVDKWKMRHRTDVARIDGNHYIIGEPNSSMKGMGGATLTIAFGDGRTVTTDNLWHQGNIPEVWREALPDNAEFVR